MSNETRIERYLCTRPMLAAELIEKGHKATRTISPWHPDRMAWAFEITDQLRADVMDYYERIGKEPPRIISDGVQQTPERR